MLFHNVTMINLYHLLSDYNNIIHNIIHNLPSLSHLKNTLEMLNSEFHKGVNANIAAISIQHIYKINASNERRLQELVFMFQNWKF